MRVGATHSRSLSYSSSPITKSARGERWSPSRTGDVASACWRCRALFALSRALFLSRASALRAGLIAPSPSGSSSSRSLRAAYCCVTSCSAWEFGRIIRYEHFFSVVSFAHRFFLVAKQPEGKGQTSSSAFLHL